MTNIFKSFLLLCLIAISVSGKAVAPKPHVGNAPPPPPPPSSSVATTTATTTTTTEVPSLPSAKVVLSSSSTTTTEVPTTTSAKVVSASTTTTEVPTIPEVTSTATATTVTELPSTNPTTSAESFSTTFVAENFVANKTFSDQIPICTCEQTKECNEKAYKKVDQCKESCKSHLEYFGTSIDKYLTCFTDATEETEKMTKCLKSNVNNFCIENSKEISYMDKPDYNVYYESYGIKEEDTLQPNPEFQKKAREVFIQQRKFQTCVIECIKKESVQCYEETKCAIGFPEKKDTDQILESCPLFKTTLHMNAMKTCQCLAFKQDVKKLVGKCAFVASPYLMRKL